MRTSLEKAQGAMVQARDDLSNGDEIMFKKHLMVAEVQAMVSQAESLDRIANALEKQHVDIVRVADLGDGIGDDDFGISQP